MTVICLKIQRDNLTYRTHAPIYQTIEVQNQTVLFSREKINGQEKANSVGFFYPVCACSICVGHSQFTGLDDRVSGFLLMPSFCWRCCQDCEEAVFLRIKVLLQLLGLYRMHFHDGFVRVSSDFYFLPFFLYVPFSVICEKDNSIEQNTQVQCIQGRNQWMSRFILMWCFWTPPSEFKMSRQHFLSDDVWALSLSVVHSLLRWCYIDHLSVFFCFVF